MKYRIYKDDAGWYYAKYRNRLGRWCKIGENPPECFVEGGTWITEEKAMEAIKEKSKSLKYKRNKRRIKEGKVE